MSYDENKNQTKTGKANLEPNNKTLTQKHESKTNLI
jgi:hypothetical protein